MSRKDKNVYDDKDDDYSKGRSDGEMPALRTRVGEADSGSAQSLPELQADEMGSAEPLGRDVKLRRKKGWGFIYFIETENGEYVKIGFSVQPEVRLQELATNCPFALRLLGFMPGDCATERHVHKRFGKDRMNGEWFRNSDPLRTFMRGMGLMMPESMASITDDWQPPEELELLATNQNVDVDITAEKTTEEMMQAVFSMMGRRGGPARAKALSAKRRSEIASEAATKRWAEVKKKKAAKK